MIPAKISSCVDCATPIIGERLRCPACHDRHAADLADEDTTLPRERSARPASVRGGLFRGGFSLWLNICLTVIGVLILMMIVLGLLAVVVRNYL